MIAISASSLSKTYRSGVFRRETVPALTDFSLEVEHGQVFGLLGPNGAGKTTFVKILLSVAFASTGSAAVLGARLPDTNIRSRIGYLPENHRFPGYLTGRQVLKLFGQLSGVSDALLGERIPRLLELVGMSQWSSMKVKKYSKGMMQRLGLAQALMNDPEVLFLDEPTDGVDPVGRKEIRDILKHLKSEGKTIFLNSHLLSEVELVSDRVAILDKGRLLKVGTVDELTATGMTYRIGYAGVLPDTLKPALLRPAGLWTSTDGLLEGDVKDGTELNKVIDLLRQSGVEISSVNRHRNSLEDSFINLLRREDGQ